jgi:hypothetical protein
MFTFQASSWYTDLMTVNRLTSYSDGNITKSNRVTVAENVPCRVYRNSNPQTKMTDTAAEVSPVDMLACDNSVDVQAGDEIFVVRGGGIGVSQPPARYFAGSPTPYYEPFGGVMPNMAHQQVPLSAETRN